MFGGALCGLGLFAFESASILHTGPAGMNVDIRGPLAAVVQAVRPQVLGIVARVGCGYLLAGSVLGLTAGLLAGLLATRRKLFWVWLLELLGMAALLTWSAAVARPALFDDVPRLVPVLRLLIDGGEPWHPLAVAALALGIHLAAAWRAGLRPRWRGVAVGVGAGALFLGAAGVGLRTAPNHPLIVLFGIDAFRPDRLHRLSPAPTLAPHLERFLEDATSFDRAYTPIAQTEPAWRSLLTARWPFATGVRVPLTPAIHRAELPTFPAALAAAGWKTRFQTDCSRFNWQGPDSGFEETQQPPRGALNFALEKLRYRGLGIFGDNRLGVLLVPELLENRAIAGLYDPQRYARGLTESLLKEASTGPALFAFHATAAHFPGDPVYPYYRHRLGPEVPLERRLRMVYSPIEVPGSSGTGQVRGRRSDSEGLYDELLEEADAQFGTLIDGLQSAGLYDQATVIVFSDHGESFHADVPAIEGSTPVHGARLSEEENRILLAIKLPSQRGSGQRIDALTRLIDIGPTVLELAGLPPLKEADGQSLLPLIEGDQNLAPRLLYAETGFTHARPDVFDGEHQAGAPRSFEAYQLQPDGTIEMAESALAAALKEKDIGAFDGRQWLIRSPRRDGTVLERWVGDGRPDGLRVWLSALVPGTFSGTTGGRP